MGGFSTIGLGKHGITHAAGGSDPIPDGGISRAQLEYPTVDVNFAYLASIGKTKGCYHHLNLYGVITITADSFTDKAVDAWIWDRSSGIYGRVTDRANHYRAVIDSGQSTKDFAIERFVNNTGTTLGYEAVDIGGQTAQLLKFSLSGSTLKGYRSNPVGSSDTATDLKITVTDTTFASGGFGPMSHLSGGGHSEAAIAWLRAPSSPGLSSIAVVEIETVGSGSVEDPFRPLLVEEPVEVKSLTNLPSFLYVEAKKYEILKSKGFTDEEMKLILGYIPQHQVDLNSVSFGAFEFSDKSPTNIIIIQGYNPYKQGAVERQVEHVRNKGLRVFTPPRDYREAVELYSNLKKEFPHWLAGKDNYAYQVLGWEVLDDMQCVDFYYGELIEHKTHYDQLKQVLDFEIENRLATLEDKLSRVNVLIEERDKHISKIREIQKKGW